MEIKGKVVQLLGEQSGQGKNGPWKKNSFVLETTGTYPKKVCIDVWGDKFAQMPIKENEMVTAHIDVESREWQGKWFTDVKAWKVEAGDGGTSPATSASGQSVQEPPADFGKAPAGDEPDFADDYEDDLPF